MAASGQGLEILASCSEVTLFIRTSFHKSFISRLSSFKARFQCFGQLPGNHAFHKEILSYILMGNVLSAKKSKLCSFRARFPSLALLLESDIFHNEIPLQILRFRAWWFQVPDFTVLASCLKATFFIRRLPCKSSVFRPGGFMTRFPSLR